MTINENCPCKKKKCERHGKCDECRKHHAESKRQRPVYCEKLMGELSKLPNIGKTVEEQLGQVGIRTEDELKEIGAKAAWLRIQSIDDSACIHRLMALEGAIRGVKKTMLPDEVKADLKRFYQEHRH